MTLKYCKTLIYNENKLHIDSFFILQEVFNMFQYYKMMD